MLKILRIQKSLLYCAEGNGGVINDFKMNVQNSNSNSWSGGANGSGGSSGISAGINVSKQTQCIMMSAWCNIYEEGQKCNKGAEYLMIVAY